jgi:ribosome maturation factor RimP
MRVGFPLSCFSGTLRERTDVPSNHRKVSRAGCHDFGCATEVMGKNQGMKRFSRAGCCGLRIRDRSDGQESRCKEVSRAGCRGVEMAKKNIVETVKEMLADFLPDNGYELWNAEFVKEGRDFNLKVYIDSEDGIGADDCERVSRYLSEKLDETDPIETPYYLIVSSPGMDRPLLTPEHFKRYAGTPVDVSLYKGVNGKKAYSGILGERTDEYLILYTEEGDSSNNDTDLSSGDLLDADGGAIKLPVALISKVRLQVIF